MKDLRETYRKCMLLLALIMIAGLIALVPVLQAHVPTLLPLLLAAMLLVFYCLFLVVSYLLEKKMWGEFAPLATNKSDAVDRIVALAVSLIALLCSRQISRLIASLFSSGEPSAYFQEQSQFYVAIVLLVLIFIIFSFTEMYRRMDFHNARGVQKQLPATDVTDATE